jgi:hypothetical protein
MRCGSSLLAVAALLRASAFLLPLHVQAAVAFGFELLGVGEFANADGGDFTGALRFRGHGFATFGLVTGAARLVQPSDTGVCGGGQAALGEASQDVRVGPGYFG